MRLRADLQQIESLFIPHQAGQAPKHLSSVLLVMIVQVPAYYQGLANLATLG